MLLVNINVKPSAHILFLSFIPRSILIKNNNTHIAQGLKPSKSPIMTVTIGRAIFLVSTLPIKGMSNTLLSKSSKYLNISTSSLISYVGNFISPINSPTLS